MQALDLDVATEFLLIAATLVELKTRRLLPGRDDVDLDEELALWEERDLLLARLLECKTFKDAAAALERLSSAAGRSYPRRVGLEERFVGLLPDLLEGVTPAQVRAALPAGAGAQASRPGSTSTTSRRSGPACATPSRNCSTSCPASARITFRRLTAAWPSGSRSSCASSRARAVQAGRRRARPGRALRRDPGHLAGHREGEAGDMARRLLVDAESYD